MDTNNITDKDRLDYLQRITRGGIQMRWSYHDRGWRLHEAPMSQCVSSNVREEIDAFIRKETEAP